MSVPAPATDPTASAAPTAAGVGIDLPAPSKTEAANADAMVEASVIEVHRTNLRRELDSLFADEDADLDEALRDGDAPVDALATVNARRSKADEAFVARVRAFLADPAAVGYALEEIVQAENEEERVARLYRAMAKRAADRAARTRALLWPFVEMYARVHPPKKRTKSWEFPTTEARVTLRKHDARLEVVDEVAAEAALRDALGTAAALDAGALRVRTEVVPGAARKALEAAGQDPSTLAGTRYEPAGERLTLYRGRKEKES